MAPCANKDENLHFFPKFNRKPLKSFKQGETESDSRYKKVDEFFKTVLVLKNSRKQRLFCSSTEVNSEGKCRENQPELCQSFLSS